MLLIRGAPTRFIPTSTGLKPGHYVRIVEQGQIVLRRGVAELLAELRAAGIRLAIATTTSPEPSFRIAVVSQEHRFWSSNWSFGMDKTADAERGIPDQASA